MKLFFYNLVISKKIFHNHMNSRHSKSIGATDCKNLQIKQINKTVKLLNSDQYLHFDY